jgi:hypothetical protein
MSAPGGAARSRDNRLPAVEGAVQEDDLTARHADLGKIAGLDIAPSAACADIQLIREGVLVSAEVP